MTLKEIENDAVQRGYSRLPKRAANLLQRVNAPPRLIAHHILVHDTAVQLLAGIELLQTEHVDQDSVCFGAATHDIGKAVRLSELSEPGKTHEEAGRALLVSHGVADSDARFTVSHGLPFESASNTIEDRLVALADKCWKGKRINELEEQLARELAEANDLGFFDVLLKLSDLVETVSEAASSRLGWQNKHPDSG